MKQAIQERLDNDPLSRTTKAVEEFFQKTRDTECYSSIKDQLTFSKIIPGIAHKEVLTDMRKIFLKPNDRLIISKVTKTPVIFNRPLKPETLIVIKRWPGFEDADTGPSDWETREWVIGEGGDIKFHGIKPGYDNPINRGPLGPDSLIYGQLMEEVREQLNDALNKIT